MKKTWEDFEDVSYKPGKNRKVKLSAGLRRQADKSKDINDIARVDSGARQAALIEDKEVSKDYPNSQILVIPEIGPSLNEYGRSTKGKRKSGKLVKSWNQNIKQLVHEQGLKAVQNYPVQVVVECYFGDGRKRFDWDNLSPTPKLIQDALVHAEILQNDSAPYIESGTMKALKTKGESYTLFVIIERQAA